MGMDIFGKRPNGRRGGYFRADIAMWGAIHMVCDKAIEASGLPFVTEDWGFNDGEGLAAQEHCDLLAEALKKYIKEHQPENGIFRMEDGSSERNGTKRSKTGTKRMLATPFEVSVTEMKEFILFLKKCGGFEIQ